MQERLLRYYSKHCGLFVSNFRRALAGFDEEAVHDMRVAVKRIRAVYLLMERMFPNKYIAETEEGQLKELFRLSGRMRDAHVQQQLLNTYADQLSTSFPEYAASLKAAEKKAVRKFTKFLNGFDAEADLQKKLLNFTSLIKYADKDMIRNNVIFLVDELMEAVGTMRDDQMGDENLHEIRRKLKQCHNLLTLFDKDDPDLPQLNLTIQKLDLVNDLLGKWHDQLVAMEMLDRFLDTQNGKETSGKNRYLLLREKLQVNRHALHVKILNYFEEVLNF
jgi:CHAD domain-containing protein